MPYGARGIFTSSRFREKLRGRRLTIRSSSQYRLCVRVHFCGWVWLHARLDHIGEITRAEFEQLVASGAMAEIELEDLRSTLEMQEKCEE